MRRKKHFFCILAVLLLILGDCLYWTLPLSLERAIPDEDWNQAELLYFDEYFNMREITLDEGTLQQILTSLSTARVSNGPRFHTMSQPYFLLYLYSDEGYPCSLTIVENGDISVTDDWVTDHRKYFDGGEELYEYLRMLSANLPAVFPAA